MLNSIHVFVLEVWYTIPESICTFHLLCTLSVHLQLGVLLAAITCVTHQSTYLWSGLSASLKVNIDCG